MSKEKAEGAKCADFEPDESVILEGDRPCCGVCKWNCRASGECLIGREA